MHLNCRSCQFVHREQLTEHLIQQLALQQEVEYRSITPIASDRVQQIEWRKRIIAWMIEAANEFEMDIKTVATAVNYMDRYFTEIDANKSLIQLIAMVALSIASKINESHPVTMNEMLELCKGTFNKTDILDIERQLLGILKWKLNPPTSYCFARKLLCFIEDVELRNQLLTEILPLLDECLKDHTYVAFAASTVAFAAINVVFHRREHPLNPWILYGAEVSNWPTADVTACIMSIRGVRAPIILPRARADSPTSVEEMVQGAFPSNNPGRPMKTKITTTIVVDVASSTKRQRRS